MKQTAYCLLLIVALFFQLSSCKKNEINEVREEWKRGIVFINEKPSYFDFTKFGNGFFASEKWIKKHNGKLIKAGRISDDTDFKTKKALLITYTIQDDPYSPIYEIPGEKYYYKVENYKAYVSLDGNEWDQLTISNVDLSSRKRGNYAEIYATFFLKCKWFEGEYNFEREIY